MRPARSLVVAALSLSTACSTATTGHPTAATTIPATTTTSKPPEYSLARLCELLSPEEAQQLGGSAEGEKGNSIKDGHTICQWSDKTSLVVGFQFDMTTANAETGLGATLTPTTVDGLKAVQQLKTDPVAICQVMVELPSGKLFSTSAATLSAGEGRYDPCQVATQLANLVIPRVRTQ